MSDNLFAPPAQPQSDVTFTRAKVSGVAAEGLKLSFMEQPSQKTYTALASCQAKVGDFVLCASMSGTWVVLGVLK